MGVSRRADLGGLTSASTRETGKHENEGISVGYLFLPVPDTGCPFTCHEPI